MELLVSLQSGQWILPCCLLRHFISQKGFNGNDDTLYFSVITISMLKYTIFFLFILFLKILFIYF